MSIQQIKFRRDPAATWTSNNPVLAAGEPGFETDTGKHKIGDGSTAWNSLTYTAQLDSTGKLKSTQIPTSLETTSGAQAKATQAKNEAGTYTNSQITEVSTMITNLDNATNALLDALDIRVTADIAGHDTAIGALQTDVTNLTNADVAISLDVSNLTTSLSNHSIDTTSVHGIADTSLLETTSGAQSKANAAQAAAEATAAAALAAITTDDVAETTATLYYTDTRARAAFSGTAPISITSGAIGLGYDGSTISLNGFNKLAVNTSVIATKSSVDLKAPLAGPTFTGTLTAADVTVTGNLTVQGTTTTVSATDLVVSDPLIYLGEGNTGNAVDLGFVANFNDGTYQHTGLVRDSSAGKWKLFKGVTDEPTTTVNFTQGSLDTLAVDAIEATSATIGDVSNTELQYLNGVTSAIQPQLDAKAAIGDLITHESDTSAHGVTGAIVGTTDTQELTNKTISSSYVYAYGGGTADGILGWNSTTKRLTVGDGGLNPVPIMPELPLIFSKSGSYTLTLDDRSNLVEMSGGGTLTVPTNSSVAYPIGTTIDILQTGSSQVTVAGASGVTVNATPGLKLRAQWSSAHLIKRGTDTWVLVGDLSA